MKIYVLILLYISIAFQVFAQDNNEEILDMQVVATKTPKRASDAATDVVVITAEDLKATGASSITEILRENGIVASDGNSRNSGAEVYIQGLDASKILIVIDGQRVRPGLFDSAVALTRMPLSSIERIEIVKGPSSFLWGSAAMAGVIYIETKKGSNIEGFTGSTGVAYQNNFNLDDDDHFVRPYINLSYNKGPMSYWMGGSFEYAYNWLSEYSLGGIGGIERIPNERVDYNNFDVYGGTKIDFLDIHSFEISASYQQENVENLSVDDPDSYKRAMVNLGYTVYPTDSIDLSFNTGMSYDNSKRFTVVPGNKTHEDYYIFNNNDLLGIFYINDILTLKGGYSLDVEVFNDVSEEEEYSQQNHALFFGGDVEIESVVDVDVTLGARYQLNARQAKSFDDTTLHSFSPELGVVFKPIDMIAIKGHVGHSFRVPDLTDSYRPIDIGFGFYFGPNPELKPETSWGYSGAVEVTPIKELTLSVGVFRNDLKNLIDFADSGETHNGLPINIFTNIGVAYTWGITAGVLGDVDIPYFGTLIYNVNFEKLYAREVLPEDEQYISLEGKRFNPRLEERPDWTLSWGLTWKKEVWGTSIKFSGYYFGEGYEYLNQGRGVYEEVRTPSQTTFDIRIAQEILPGDKDAPLNSIVFFEVKNILNATYDEDGDGDTDVRGRHFVVGFDLTF